MQITIDIPNPPTNQAIIDIPLHFCGGKVVEAGGYGFEERVGRWVPNAVGVYRCSNCHSNMKLKKGRPPKYCDECGYFMVPEEEKEVQEQNCDTCRFTPPGKKWPCEDCLYADRWEAKMK